MSTTETRDRADLGELLRAKIRPTVGGRSYAIRPSRCRMISCGAGGQLKSGKAYAVRRLGCRMIPCAEKWGRSPSLAILKRHRTPMLSARRHDPHSRSHTRIEVRLERDRCLQGS